MQEKEIIQVKFVAFVADVINCTAQTNNRTEKLKIIKSAAACHLDIKDTSIDQIQSLQGQPEGASCSQELKGGQRSKT